MPNARVQAPRIHPRRPAQSPGPRAPASLEPELPTLAELGEGIDWRALEPRGLYARLGRPLLDVALLALAFLPALALGALIAAANALQLRSLREVFFVQPRVGRRGRVFRLIKFRTMRASADGDFASWGRGDRLRVTPFGRFLRNSHLDELPQLVNVLLGDMSFIGPRPEMLEVERWASEHVPGFLARLAVKPGLTGPAQITQGYTGQDVAAYAEKLAINQRALARITLAGDLATLARTALWMLRGRGWRWNAPAKPGAAGS